MRKKSKFAKSVTQIWHSQQSLTRKQWTISIVVMVGLQNMLSSVWCCCDKTYVLKKKNIQEMLYIFFLLKQIMIIFNDNSLDSKPISLSRAHECKHFEYLMWHYNLHILMQIFVETTNMKGRCVEPIWGLIPRS